MEHVRSMQTTDKMTIRDVSVKMIYSGTELKICFGIIFVFIEYEYLCGRKMLHIYTFGLLLLSVFM